MEPRPEFDYALPTYDRTAQKARGDDGNIPTSPMPSARVRPDWTGKTKDQVAAKPDWIPEEVRSIPRPYLVIPRRHETQAVADRRAKKDQKLATRAPTQQVRSEPQRSDLTMALPPPMMPFFWTANLHCHRPHQRLRRVQLREWDVSRVLHSTRQR